MVRRLYDICHDSNYHDNDYKGDRARDDRRNGYGNGHKR